MKGYDVSSFTALLEDEVLDACKEMDVVDYGKVMNIVLN